MSCTEYFHLPAPRSLLTSCHRPLRSLKKKQNKTIFHLVKHLSSDRKTKNNRAHLFASKQHVLKKYILTSFAVVVAFPTSSPTAFFYPLVRKNPSMIVLTHRQQYHKRNKRKEQTTYNEIFVCHRR